MSNNPGSLERPLSRAAAIRRRGGVGSACKDQVSLVRCSRFGAADLRSSSATRPVRRQTKPDADALLCSMGAWML